MKSSSRHADGGASLHLLRQLNSSPSTAVLPPNRPLSAGNVDTAATPVLWNSLFVSSGPLWHLVHCALPVNNFKPATSSAVSTSSGDRPVRVNLST